MYKRKITALTILLFAMATILTACGSSNSSSSSSAPPVTIAPSSPEKSGGGNYDYGESDYISSEDGFYLGETANSPENTTPADRKIIRNASLEIVAEDASSLYKNIVDHGAGLGGYEHSYSISNYETYSVIYAVFKIPPEKLSDFIDFIGECGEVINTSLNSEDITENYYDAETRLETKRKSLDQYYQLLQKASNVEEIVYIHRIIDGITEDIESYEGRLKLWNSQINMSTVNIRIRQDNDPLQFRKEISWNTLNAGDMGYLIKRGFVSITNSIVSVLQWFVVILIGYSPLWIILAAGVFLLRKLRKKNNAAVGIFPWRKLRKRKANEKPSQEE